MNPSRNVLWQVNSRHAEVICFERGGGIFVEKTVAPTVNLGDQVLEVNELSAAFRSKLHALSVPLAEPYRFDEREGKAIQTSPYVGPDLEKLIKEAGFTTGLLDQTIHAMRGVLTQNPREVGIDARLSNFCLGPNGVVYVDTFPPMLLHEGSYIVHFPNPTDPRIIRQEIFRKFDPLGIMRRFRFSIMEQDAGIKDEDLLCALNNVMGEEFTQNVNDYFQTLPDQFDPEHALASLTLEDPDGIREVALRRMPSKGPERAEFLRKVFDLSSNFCPIKMEPSEQLKAIRELLQ